MKILLIQENGRHVENRKFRECFNFKRAFDRLGVDSDIWGLGHENFHLDFDMVSKEYDVFFILENYEENNWIPDLSKSKKFKVFWSIDSHCNPQGNIRIAEKNKVNLVLNAIESDQHLFKDTVTRYFPNACPTDVVFPVDSIEKKHFIGFCGTPFQYRINSMKLIEEKFGLEIKKDFYTLGDKMVDSINSYKIHFNESENDDINYRVFETMGTNTMLLTTKNENIETFFTDMVDIVTYDNSNEMLDKIEFLLQNQEMIKTISKNGYEKTILNHSFDIRAKQLIKIIEQTI